jgi:hypothetical protein
VAAAPVTLASTITTAALTGTTLTLTTIAMTTFQKIAVTAALAVTIGGGLYAAKLAHNAQREATRLRAQQAPMQEKILQLQGDLASASNTMAGLEGDYAKSRKDNFELLKLRGQVGVLKNQADELSRENRELQKQAAMNPPTNAATVNQIHLKSRFVSVPKGALTGTESLTGNLSFSQFTNMFAIITRMDGVEILGEPEVTTSNGRETQMRATSVITVVTNMALLETNGSVAMVPQTEEVETGPVLESTPSILADGHSIELPVTASVTDFLGYAGTNNTIPAYTQDGQRVDIPQYSPQFRVEKSTAKLNLADNQTLVLKLDDKPVTSGPPMVDSAGEEAGSPNSDYLVFITATIVDPAGRRVNEEPEAGGDHQ